jgi:hypothetical protein
MGIENNLDSVFDVHQRVREDLLEIYGQGAFRIDDEGYEYVDPKYEDEYYILYDKYVHNLCRPLSSM